MATEPSNQTTTQPPGLEERERAGDTATGLSINESAPAIARATARIDAAPEIVFRILSNVANWPSWQHSVSSVEIEGRVSSGATFRWKTGGSRIVSTVELFDPPHAIGWRGRTFGTRAIHAWRLAPEGSGTQVETEESFEGWLVSLLRPLMRRVLRRGVDTAIADLKHEAERQAARGESRESPTAAR